MACYPAKQEKTIIIREINADTFMSPFDYWLQTDMLRRRCDELHTIWGPPPLERRTSMTDLSPAAQAVLDAFTGDDTIYGLHLMTPRLAAALRAVAERNEYKPDMRDEMEVMFSEGWNSHRAELLSIAAELEAL